VGACFYVTVLAWRKYATILPAQNKIDKHTQNEINHLDRMTNEKLPETFRRKKKMTP
jgi:hypothetical protein